MTNLRLIKSNLTDKQLIENKLVSLQKYLKNSNEDFTEELLSFIIEYVELFEPTRDLEVTHAALVTAYIHLNKHHELELTD